MSDTSTALVVRRPTALGNYQPPPGKAELGEIIALANYLAKVPGFLPTMYYGQPYKIMAAMLYARELGISNFIALQHMQVIDGKAGADAQLMASLVIRAGHSIDPCLDRKVPGQSRTCRITRGDNGNVYEVTWTIDMARKAELIRERSGWVKYPDSMLWARALSQCAREACPDALMGISYTPEEIGGEVIDAQYAEVGADIPLEIPEAQVNNGPAQVGERSEAPAPQGAQTGSAQTTAPAPPAAPVQPSEQREVGTVHVGAQKPSSASQGETAAPSTSPSTPDRSARSVGPKPKRSNVVPANQTIPAPTAEVPPAIPPGAEEQRPAGSEVSSALAGTPASPEPPPPPQTAPEFHPVSLTDETPAPESAQEEDGKVVYLNSLRNEARKGAATLHLLRVKIKNQKFALAAQPLLPEPPVTPNADSDESLRLFIDQNYPSRTLADLREGELENVLGVIQGLIDKIHETGVKE